MYLNQIYFGHGAYGINAAAKFYFNCNAEELTAVQAALLAGLPSAPNRYSPLRHPRAAFERNKQVIHNMILSGYISRSSVASEFNTFWNSFLDELKVRYQTLGIRNKKFDKAPYFTEYIRRILIDKYGKAKVYRGGLKVYTTLDLRQQEVAQKVMKEAVDRQNTVAIYHNRNKLQNIDNIITRINLRKRRVPASERRQYTSFLRKVRKDSIDEILFVTMLFDQDDLTSLLTKYLTDYERLRFKSRVEGALVAIMPKTGDITAMVGGGEFNSINQLNRAVQARRQPGSSFKPFVFGAGIEHGIITAATAFLDAPIVFKGRRKKWAPSNYDKTFFGNVLVRKALAYSLNIVSVLIYEAVGGTKIVNFASKCIGIPKSRFEMDPTLALGTTELTPLEMARGFAVFANQGRNVIPFSIKKIVDMNNNTVYQKRRYTGKQLISKETAFIMTSLLREVVDRGTATRAIRSAAGFRKPAAGKTGTNTNFRDAWFVGYTPDLVAAVWLGCDSQNFILGRGQSAAVVAAPAWGKFMSGIYEFTKYTNFGKKPKNVIRMQICSKTGKIPIRSCPRRYEYFTKGTQPIARCDGQHNEMMSIFDLVKKDKKKLEQKMKLFSDDEEDEPEESDSRFEDPRVESN
jgi:penicillin-binding protein 1A